ncbi:MAG: SDR family oxidoreductase [Solirubrobacterales bacterium]|nr:SDR family oxidoreductase [Solirubrobacterales bacterium]
MRPSEAAGSILITGAASGIGAACALSAAEQGHALVLGDLDADALAKAAEACEAAGAAGVVRAALDVRDSGQIAALVDAGEKAFGQVDRAITSAGVDRGEPAHEMGEEIWDLVLDINLKGTFLTCREVIGRLVAADRPGSVVCVSSIAAVAGIDGAAAYCASKGGVSAMVRSLGVEYAPRGIRVNAIAPGATETPLMWANVDEAESAAVRQEVDEVIPIGRLAQPREQAQAALWLLSEQASYVTGSVLTADGGVTATMVLPA